MKVAEIQLGERASPGDMSERDQDLSAPREQKNWSFFLLVAALCELAEVVLERSSG